jgi:methionyl-tRNA formyltransferase
MLINRAYQRIQCLYASISTSDKVVFFGSDDIAAPSLKALHLNFKNLEVVTHHTRPGIKQDNKVELYCKQHNVSIANY